MQEHLFKIGNESPHNTVFCQTCGEMFRAEIRDIDGGKMAVVDPAVVQGSCTGSPDKREALVQRRRAQAGDLLALLIAVRHGHINCHDEDGDGMDVTITTYVEQMFPSVPTTWEWGSGGGYLTSYTFETEEDAMIFYRVASQHSTRTAILHSVVVTSIGDEGGKALWSRTKKAWMGDPRIRRFEWR